MQHLALKVSTHYLNRAFESHVNIKCTGTLIYVVRHATAQYGAYPTSTPYAQADEYYKPTFPQSHASPAEQCEKRLSPHATVN